MSLSNMSCNLEASERKISSQNGEDGIIEAIFAEIGVTNRYFVEFGCEQAVECNTANLLAQGWTGLLMDYGGISKNPLADVKKEFITAENIESLFAKYQVPRDSTCSRLIWMATTFGCGRRSATGRGSW